MWLVALTLFFMLYTIHPCATLLILLLWLLSFGDSHCGGEDMDWAIVKVRAELSDSD